MAVVEKKHEKGDLGLTFSTDVAVASLLALDSDKKRPVLVNVRTIIRNLQHSIPRATLTAKQTYDLLKEDLTILSKTLTSAGFPVILYTTTHQSLRKEFPHGLLWSPKTNIQRYYAEVEQRLIMALSKDGDLGNKLAVFDVWLKTSEAPEAYILTHMQIDLLSDKNFRDLILVESNTGTLKTRNDWNTKLNCAKDIRVRLPFNSLTLQVFGDNEVFKPMLRPIKELIIKIAKESKWSPLTTRDKIKFNLNSQSDKMTASILTKCLK